MSNPALVFQGAWQKIDGDDYMDEALEDGRQFRALIKVDDLETGSVGYFGILEDEEEDE